MTDAVKAQSGLLSEETTGTTTIPDKETSSQLAQLNDLQAQATLKYSIKDYDAAAELFSQATELQAEINGEMASQNADLLYHYGRCLYHVAVGHSDVLGSKVAGEKRPDGPSKPKAKRIAQDCGTQTNGTSDNQQLVNKEIVTKVVEEKDGPIAPAQQHDNASKPFFQFTGDENFDDPGDEDENAVDEGQDGEAEEEEDDFVNAYEVLDLARVLLLNRLKEEQGGKGKETEPSAAVKQLKERLADTHDLQAEISLEGERFPNAVGDLRSALELKEELYPPESSLIAETHYKLSLALEFSSVTQQKGQNEEAAVDGEATVDEDMREEAAQEMEAAIASCKLRVQKEETRLADTTTASQASVEPEVTQADVDNVKEVVSDMEQRLVELRQPPVSINDPKGIGSIDGADPVAGILGSIFGESDAVQKARMEEVSATAKDLTGLVKRKKGSSAPSPQAVPSELAQTNGKRKVEFDEEVVEVGTGKKAKLSDEEDD